jgi:hypothetical protein
MQTLRLCKSYFIVSVVIFLLLGSTAFHASAQVARKLQEHEVIDMANGMKMEVLRFRGEGATEECEVIYYTDARQSGTRKWEPTAKVLRLKQASQILSEATKVATQPNRHAASTDASAKGEPVRKVPTFKDTATKKVVTTANKHATKNVSPFSQPSNTNATNQVKSKTPATTHINEVTTDSYTLTSVEKKLSKTTPAPTKQTTVLSKTPAINPASKVNNTAVYAHTKPNTQTKTTSSQTTASKTPAASNISNPTNTTGYNKTSVYKGTASTASTSARPNNTRSYEQPVTTNAYSKTPTKNEVPSNIVVTHASPAKQAILQKASPTPTPVYNTTINKPAFADTGSTVRVAVFAPIYLDDAFTGTTYNLGKSVLPKNILPGLEFYNGVMMAVDSLGTEGANVEVSIFDTKQITQSLAQILSSPQLTNTGLIIAAITNPTELKLFSQFALSKNIPLISATYPNTVGVAGNPFFVLLNSSFPAHIEGLYKHMQRYYASNTIVAVKQAGTKDDYVKNYITALNKNTRSVPLSIKWVELKPGFTSFDLMRNLDSTRNNVVFVASPIESFGLDVVRTLSLNESYRCTAIGMPTWDGIRELNGKDCQNVEVVYSTPFVFNSNNRELSNEVVRTYREKYYSRPSDMVYKGYEATYHFSRLLTKYRTNLINNLSDKQFTLFNQFDIQPVKLKSGNLKPDYLENKKLYFIKKQQGVVKNIL